MSKAEEYDALLLGSGEAGKYLAWTFAKSGKRVAVIERKYVGGSCPNIACLPSKNIIHGAKVASYFARSEEFGITKENFRIDMAGVRDRKRAMVGGLIATHLQQYKKSGAELVMGTGRFIAPKTIEVALADGGTRVLRGGHVVISTGSRATIDPIPGLPEARPLTHIEALELDVVPEHLVIMGAGFVGLEIAQAMRRFGSRVTIVDRNGRLAPREDDDVSEALQQLFIDEGIDVKTGVSVTRVEGVSGESITLHGSQAGAAIAIHGSHLLVATGRTPNTEGIGLEIAGVATDSLNYVQVNERLETTAADVFAVGDCAGSPKFTHIAFDDYRIVRDNLAGGHRVTTGRQVPYCLFTDPEFARIGLNEVDAAARRINYRLFKIPLGLILRTQTLSETRGFVKALIDTSSDRILGFMAFGVAAGEMMAVVQIAMTAGLPYTALRDSILTHPTMAEGLTVLLSSTPQLRERARKPAFFC